VRRSPPRRNFAEWRAAALLGLPVFAAENHTAADGVDGGFERRLLQFAPSFFNFTNTPTLFLAAASSPTLTCRGPPGGASNASNPSFGKLRSGTATGRQIQFGMKLYF
jgi:hypothetical protein